MCISIDSSLALFATGKTTGVVLDSGNAYTTAVSLHDGNME